MENPVCKSICKIMLKEHEKINNLINEFENYPENQNLNKLNTEIENHFFIEEKIIFSVYSLEIKDKEKYRNQDIEEDLTTSLIKQHKDILWLIKNLSENFNKNKIIELKKQLTKHISLENNNFYPRIDTELDENQKHLIIDRIENNNN